jgi:hypothetical protein
MLRYVGDVGQLVTHILLSATQSSIGVEFVELLRGVEGAVEDADEGKS